MQVGKTSPPEGSQIFAKTFCSWEANSIFVFLKNSAMKKMILAACLLVAGASYAQETHDKEKVQAAKGVVYGKVSEDEKPVVVDDLKTKLVNDQFEGQVKGKVAEVCQAEGCWIRMQRADGTTMMVRAKDHAFLMPANIVGKTVMIEGAAVVKEVSEAQRRHYAEDAGKSKAEIEKIKGAEKDVQFAAKGVKVLD